jgi:hypothetical protein
MFMNHITRSDVCSRSALRCVFATIVAITLSTLGSPCQTESRICLTEHHCRSQTQCGMLAGSASLGKHACASAPVDFNRATASRHLAAPRIAAPVPANVFQLHSRPGATKVIYLDFDGQVTRSTPWNQSTATITTTAYDVDSNPSSFSSTELANIYEIWQRVAECYSPFDVDVTTQAPAVADLINTGSGDTKWGIRVLFGVSTPSPAPNSGGVAYVGGFGWNYGKGADVPCFVLQDGVGTVPKYNADAAVHEAGHTLGLSHDGLYPANSSKHVEYYEGQGTGKVAWAPHLGAGYYVPLVQWSKGEYANASNTEDDLNIIATQNGFGVRVDDFASAQSAAVQIPGATGSGTYQISVSGVIETRADTDWFKLTAGAGTLTVNAVGGPANSMLDIQLSLYDANGSLVTTANPPDDIVASLSQTVTSGVYYLKVEGVALGSPLTTGYTDYSSLGQYTISGSYSTSSTLTNTNAPILSGTGDLFYPVKSAPLAINPNIKITDSDSTTMANASVKIQTPVPSQDVLSLAVNSQTMGNIVASYDSSTGTLSLTSAGATATLAQFQTAFRAVAYSNSSASPTTTPRKVNFIVSDGTKASNVLVSTVSIGNYHVAATYNASTKNLTLTDDANDNAIAITLRGSQLTIQGAGATLIGTGASAVQSVSFTVGSDVKVVGTFTGGNDQISISGLRSSSMAFSLGDGNDGLSLTLCNITKLTVDGGAGTDTVTTSGTVITSKTYTAVP